MQHQPTLYERFACSALKERGDEPFFNVPLVQEPEMQFVARAFEKFGCTVELSTSNFQLKVVPPLAIE